MAKHNIFDLFGSGSSAEVKATCRKASIDNVLHILMMNGAEAIEKIDIMLNTPELKAALTVDEEIDLGLLRKRITEHLNLIDEFRKNF